MKHTECEDCELGKGDSAKWFNCGYHFEMVGVTDYDIASLTACDKYGNCMFFKPKAKPKGDLISREALMKAIKAECNPYGKPTIDFESGKKVLKIVENAPIVSDRYGEGYAQGYIDGSTGADWRFEET